MSKFDLISLGESSDVGYITRERVTRGIYGFTTPEHAGGIEELGLEIEGKVVVQRLTL